MTGKYFLVGGGPAVRSMGEPLMSEFINAVGGKDAKIAIITAGTNDPAEVNACYWEIFLYWGVKNLFSPKIFSREDAQADWIFPRLAECDGVFIAGGSQYKLSQRLAETPVEQAIRAIFNKGGVVAGTSSGASIFAGPMILSGGTLDPHLKPDMIEIGQGFGMLKDISIDTHCASRGRLPRIISLIAHHPKILAIGIDEDTALLTESENVLKVVGKNAVYFLDAANASPSHSEKADEYFQAEEHLCSSNIVLHALTAGDKFDLITRKPVY